ncbi:hypothetical protein ABZ498_12205 [Streptomyces lavendulocolor]|uniref:hypothetical protein n=1 Tax=Streptomyces lavendulocolor TaxID=67316 RepID=UPI0033F0D7BE
MRRIAAALDAVDALLDGALPASGPVQREPSPDGGWGGSHGAGFRLEPLWEGRAGHGAPGQEEAGERLAALTSALEDRWGPHREVSLRALASGEDGDGPVLPLLEELHSVDGDGPGPGGALLVWGPVVTPHGPRWVAVSTAPCDGDGPPMTVAAVSDVPIEEAGEPGARRGA